MCDVSPFWAFAFRFLQRVPIFSIPAKIVENNYIVGWDAFCPNTLTEEAYLFLPYYHLVRILDLVAKITNISYHHNPYKNENIFFT